MANYEYAKTIRYQNPDKASLILEKTAEEFLAEGDTSFAIRVLEEIANIHGHRADYKGSYDYLWKALVLADRSNNDQAKSSLYIQIGRYYSFYKRDKQALPYFQKSLDLSKKAYKKDKKNAHLLVESYYAYCQTFRDFNNLRMAEIYLDSCFQFYQNDRGRVQKAELDFEKAVILSNKNQMKEALIIYNEIEKWFEIHLPSYNVLVCTFKGLTLGKMGLLTESENSFKKALGISAKYGSHIDFSPLIHQYLSKLYLQKGDYLRAYQELKIEKELDEVFFDSRSKNNRALLEIQDAFRVQKEQERQLIQKQKLEELESADKILLLQRTILIGGILFLLILGIVYFRQLRTNYRNEKALIKKAQELEIRQVNEILEHKNKEMAASALKMIEKEEIISDFKSHLEQNKWEANPAKLKKVIASLDVSQDNNWREFETRFVSVNKSFYDKLHEQFPDLTPGDDKLCALIKLNLSSKDMAKLMGISIESVHTTRYRLRKKLGLSRDENLTEFIAGF